MNKRRQITLLALPLVLGALLVGAKWKQSHPTPTKLDLQERALLRKTVKVEIWNPDYRAQIPVAEFKEALSDFYLIEDDPSRTQANLAVIPPDQIALFMMLRSSDTPSKAVAIIGVSPFGYYDTIRDSGSQRPRVVRSLHLITQRRLYELVAKYRPTK